MAGSGGQKDLDTKFFVDEWTHRYLCVIAVEPPESTSVL
jgi:hypothetical protein